MKDGTMKGWDANMKKGRTSVFKRLSAFFSLIEIIVLAVVSLMLFHDAQVKEDADRSVREESIAKAIEQFDEQIHGVYSLAERLADDNRLLRIAYHMYPNEYERSQIILSILGSLNDSSELNVSIADIQVMFPSEKVCLSYTGGYDNQAEYRTPVSDAWKEPLTYEDGVLKVQIPHPLISGFIGSVPDFECRVSFSDAFFDSILTVFGEGPEQGALLVLSNQEDMVFFSVGHEADKVNIALENAIRENGMAFVHGNVILDGHSYALTSKASQDYPITLIAWRNVDTLSANILFTLASLVLVFLLTGGLFVIFLYQGNQRVAKPIYKLMDAFDQVGKGKLDTRIHHSKKDEFDFIYDSFNRMTDRTEQLVENIKEQHNLLQNAELMQLQAQIDPHFLYNSFNIIKYMAGGEEYEQITEFVSALAQYYRFINKETRQAIPLSAEVQHMETYLYIQQMRFEERIHVEVKGLTKEADDILVPKLILQPLVENCYNHGLKNKLKDGIIHITFTQESNLLYISIEDNGDEMDQEKLTSLQTNILDTDEQSISHALANIRRRLELAYGEPDLLSLSIGKMGGLCVILRFDLDKSPSNLL